MVGLVVVHVADTPDSADNPQVTGLDVVAGPARGQRRPAAWRDVAMPRFHSGNRGVDAFSVRLVSRRLP